MLKELLFLAGMKIYERETDPVRAAERKKQEDELRRFEKGIHYQELQLDNLEEVPQRAFFQKKPELRKDVPAIDIRTKTVIGFWGKEKEVDLSPRKQKKIKKELMKYFPDRYYLDNLGQWNSYVPRNRRSRDAYYDDSSRLNDYNCGGDCDSDDD